MRSGGLAQDDLAILRMMQEQYSQEHQVEERTLEEHSVPNSEENEDDDEPYIPDEDDDGDAEEEEKQEEYFHGSWSLQHSDADERESKVSTQPSEGSFVNPHLRHADPDNFSDEKLGSMYGLHVEDVGEMRKAFSVFDQDGSGNISVLELNKVSC